MALGLGYIIIIRSPYTPDSIFSRGTKGICLLCGHRLHTGMCVFEPGAGLVCLLSESEDKFPAARCQEHI